MSLLKRGYTVIRFYSRHALHSTMSLLKHFKDETIPAEVTSLHSTMSLLKPLVDLNSALLDCTLHSTMSLLKLNLCSRSESHDRRTLHSTMSLLKRIESVYKRII